MCLFTHPNQSCHIPPPQAGLDTSKAGVRPKVSDRVALLKKALAGETAAAAQAAARPLLDAAECCAPTAEDEDAVSALFELSVSVC